METKLFESGTLDFAYSEERFECAAARIAKRFGVHVCVVKANGPGGGWPVVAIVGEMKDVAKCVSECWVSGDDDEDMLTFAYALAQGSYLP